MKKFKAFLATFILIFAFVLQIFAQVPPPPTPARLVNDFAGLFSPKQIDELENRLVAFNDTTSNVICVVTMDDLGGMEASEMAYEIGDKWGVKDKRYNSGIVILIKPKNETNGQVYIAVGYDLEAVIPDATAKQITANSMVPYFKDNDYYGGVEAALKKLMPLAAGEISADRLYESNDSPYATAIGLIVTMGIIGCFVWFIVRTVRDVKNYKGGGGKRSGSGGSSRYNDYNRSSSRSSSSSSSRSSSGSFGGFSGRGGFGGGGGGSSW